jgi:hypothetical protein
MRPFRDRVADQPEEALSFAAVAILIVCKGRSHMYRLGSPIVYQSGEPWVLRAA